MDFDEILQKTSLGRWILAHRDSDRFADALKTLVAYACAEWIRRQSGAVVSPSEALARVICLREPAIPVVSWLETPEKFAMEIVDFCEKTKNLPLPPELIFEPPHLLDLRGVVCPKNAARSRLVLEGLPENFVLEIWLDDGSPIENVPSALVSDGHRVEFREKKGDYWSIRVVRGPNK